MGSGHEEKRAGTLMSMMVSAEFSERATDKTDLGESTSMAWGKGQVRECSGISTRRGTSERVIVIPIFISYTTLRDLKISSLRIALHGIAASAE